MGKRLIVSDDKGMARNPVKCTVCGEQTYAYDKEDYYLCATCGPKYHEPVKAYFATDGYAQLPLKDFLEGMGYDDEK